MLKRDWLKLNEEARKRAFTVARLTQLDQVKDVFDAVDRALLNGSTLEEFKEDTVASMGAAWGNIDAPIYETVFRNNVQTAYGAGRWAQMNQPHIKDDRPYGKFSAVEDENECPICEACDGVILPLDDPWWEDHSPLMHHRCRCEIENLTAEEAGAPTDPDDLPGEEGDADEGFGGVPSLAFEPDLDDVPLELLDVYQQDAPDQGATDEGE
jgi:SPP1 gp7 family putative phage head morphogenesis protein